MASLDAELASMPPDETMEIADDEERMEGARQSQVTEQSTMLDDLPSINDETSMTDVTSPLPPGRNIPSTPRTTTSISRVLDSMYVSE